MPLKGSDPSRLPKAVTSPHCDTLEPMSGCRVLMKLTASHKPPGDVGRLQLGAFRRLMGSEIAGDSDEDVPTLVGIAPLAELPHAGIEYLVGMET